MLTIAQGGAFLILHKTTLDGVGNIMYIDSAL